MEKAIARTIGSNIQQRRLALNLTLCALAVEMGFSYQQLQKYEKGVNHLSAAKLVKFACVFNCTTDELCGLQPPRHSPEDQAILVSLSRIESQALRAKIREMIAALAFS
jgi:transcriptional regulator with XRE-family HTH domain